MKGPTIGTGQGLSEPQMFLCAWGRDGLTFTRMVPRIRGTEETQWKQQLLKMVLVLQMAPAIPVERFQSFYYPVFSSEFNVNISLHLTEVVDYFFFFFSKNADLGSVTLQEQSCENTYRMPFLLLLEITALWLSNHRL